MMMVVTLRERPLRLSRMDFCVPSAGSLFAKFQTAPLHRRRTECDQRGGKKVLVQIFERGRLSLFSTSPYAASTASHTCRTMAPGLVIFDVSNCPFLILFANSIPLSVTSAFPNVLNHSIG